MNCIVRHSLGRDGHLGDLYNACFDHFTGKNLFLDRLPTSLIHTKDVPECADMTMPLHDNLNSCFRRLQVDLSSQLNVLCRDAPHLPGCGQYLIDTDRFYESGKCVRQSIIYTVSTKAQKFNLFDPDVITNINIDALQRTTATHVVTKIKWGANAILTLKDEVGSMGKTRSSLKSALWDVGLDIMYRLNELNIITSANNHIDFSLTTDIELDGYPLTTVEEALTFMRDIPDILKKFYNNLGKPLVFILVPVIEIMKILKLRDPPIFVYQEITDGLINRWVNYFSEYNRILRELFDLEENIKCKDQDSYFCDYPRLLEKVSKARLNGIAYKDDLRARLARAVFEARMHGTTECINNIETDALEYFYKLFCKNEEINRYLHTVSFCEEIRNCGMDGSKRNPDYHFYAGEMCIPETKNWAERKAFVFLTRSDFKYSEADFWAHLEFFVSLREIKKAEMWIVDLYRFPEFPYERTRILEIIIRGKEVFVLSEDYFKDTENNELNLMYADCFDCVQEQPIRRAALKIICPRSLKGYGCEKKEVYWHCARCREEVEYGFDGYFYCRCGKLLYNNCRFRCNNQDHGGIIKFDDAVVLMNVLQKNYH